MLGIPIAFIPVAKRFDALLSIPKIVYPNPTVERRGEQIKERHRQSAMDCGQFLEERTKNHVTSRLRLKHHIHFLANGCAFIGIRLKIAYERERDVEFSGDFLTSVGHSPTAKRILDELYWALPIWVPILRVCDSRFQQGKAQPGSRLGTESYLVSCLNAVQMRNR